MGNDQVITLDVRELDEYETEHIPGAKSIPLSELEERIEELPKDATIRVVCNFGGQRSHKAAELLKNKGLSVDILEGGMKAWTDGSKNP